jgi:hypothetical protein
MHANPTHMALEVYRESGYKSIGESRRANDHAPGYCPIAPSAAARALLEMHHQAGEAPELNVRLDLSPGQSIGVAAQEVRGTAAIREQLLNALLEYQEGRAEALLAEVFARYPVEQVLE